MWLVKSAILILHKRKFSLILSAFIEQILKLQTLGVLHLFLLVNRLLIQLEHCFLLVECR